MPVKLILGAVVPVTAKGAVAVTLDTKPVAEMLIEPLPFKIVMLVPAVSVALLSEPVELSPISSCPSVYMICPVPPLVVGIAPGTVPLAV